MSDASDEALMTRYGQGDAEAFSELYERYRGPLYRYFLRQLGDAVQANDLYQGCWEKVIGARARFREKTPFRAWLFRIAHNHLVDYFRSHRGVQELPETLEDMAGSGPETQLEDEQRQARFSRALLALPEEQRDALLLQLEAGLSLELIAQVTGVGRETVKSRLRYGTRKLKQELGP